MMMAFLKNGRNRHLRLGDDCGGAGAADCDIVAVAGDDVVVVVVVGDRHHHEDGDGFGDRDDEHHSSAYASSFDAVGACVLCC